uniref:E2F/DP family winged-helix DNA-binding domain-containing protein n=1 Tax=Eptatretus burgeri TaxID=7764 RepID=A0A8C4X240_EPTBU
MPRCCPGCPDDHPHRRYNKKTKAIQPLVKAETPAPGCTLQDLSPAKMQCTAKGEIKKKSEESEDDKAILENGRIGPFIVEKYAVNPELSLANRCRYDSSLGLITQRFLSLMQRSPDGSIELNNAAKILGVQKRRMYDITNVLQGIQIVTKKFKNTVMWTAQFNKKDATKKLCNEIKCLSKKEEALDVLLKCQLTQLTQLLENEYYQRLAYVTYRDLLHLWDQTTFTVIAIRAPPNTCLEVYDSHCLTQFHMVLRSKEGPIHVLLCTDSDLGDDKSQGAERLFDIGKPVAALESRGSACGADSPEGVWRINDEQPAGEK